jgi:hypothetical protein
MKHSSLISWALTASMGLSIAATGAFAQTQHMGPGMRHGMGHGTAEGHGPMVGAVRMLTRQDAGSSADMALVHDMLVNHDKIRRTVTNLPDGIRTVTESDAPQVAQTIKAHVASMTERLKTGQEFNIFSTTLPVLFENRDSIKSAVEMTEKGAIVTRTSTDAKVVAALQGHATEVTELVREGMVAMRRGMMARMAMGRNSPHSDVGSSALPATTESGHAH